MTVRGGFQKEAGLELRRLCREDFAKEKTFQAGLRNNEEANLNEVTVWFLQLIYI